MSELTIQDLIDQAYGAKSSGALVLAKKIEHLLKNGVIPNPHDVDKLHKFFVVPNPCTRIDFEGKCEGWLHKHGAESGLSVVPPYKCPFAEKSEWTNCPGYAIV